MPNCCIFVYFARKLQNLALNFRAFGGKTQLVGEILRNFENLQKILQEKSKLLYFRLFCKEITKPCVKFSRVSTKNTSRCGHFENFENFQKIPDEKCKNCCIFAYFAKILQNHALYFGACVGKTQLVGEILRKFENLQKTPEEKCKN